MSSTTSDSKPGKVRKGPKKDEIFLGDVELSPSRTALVYRGTHGGRDFIRMRVWYLHRTKLVWYPAPHRSFIFPAEHAEAMAEVLLAGAWNISSEKPDWLVYRETTGQDDPRAAELVHLEHGIASDEVVPAA